MFVSLTIRQVLIVFVVQDFGIASTLQYSSLSLRVVTPMKDILK